MTARLDQVGPTAGRRGPDDPGEDLDVPEFVPRA